MAEEVELSIVQDDSGPSLADTMEKAADAAERAARAMERMNQAEREMAERERLRAQASGAAAAAAGGAGGGGGFWGGGGGGWSYQFAAAGQAAHQASRAIDSLTNSTLTAGQKLQHFSEGLPIIGTLIGGLRHLVEAVNGTTDGLRRISIMHEITMGSEAARFHGGQREAAQRTQFGGLAARAASLRGFATAGFGGLGLPDIGDLNDPMRRASWERQIGIESQQGPLKADIAAASAELRGLRDREAALMGERGNARERLDEYTGRFQRGGGFGGGAGGRSWGGWASRDLAAEVGGGGAGSLGVGGKSWMAEAASGALAAASQLNRVEQEMGQNKVAQQAKLTEIKEKETALARVTLERDKERLQVLKEQEGMIRGQAHSFGLMTRGEQQHMLNLARQLASRGAGSMSPAMLQQLGRAIPYTVAREAEAMGEASPYLQEIRRLNPNDPTSGNLRANMQGQTNLQKQIMAGTASLSADLADAIVAAFRTMMMEVIKQLKKEEGATIGSILTGIMQRNVQQGNR